MPPSAIEYLLFWILTQQMLMFTDVYDAHRSRLSAWGQVVDPPNQPSLHGGQTALGRQCCLILFDTRLYA